MTVGELNELKDIYLAIGIGGFSFLVLVSMMWFLLKSVIPLLQQIKQDGAVTQSVIQNNTKAIEEMSRSNQNVATALTILDKSMTNVHSDVKKVGDKAESLENLILIMNEKLNK